MRVRRAGLVLLLGVLVVVGTRLPGFAGAACVWPAVGVFPGMALAAWVARREPRIVRTLLGLALSPMTAAAAGWALLRAGLPIRSATIAVAAVSGLVWLVAEVVAPPPPPDPAQAEPAGVRRIAWGLGAAVALVPLVNSFMLLYSDGWIHAALAWEILVRGVPPQDPRFAGLALNYVWLFNLDLAMLTSLGGQEPFAFMAVINVVSAVLCVRIAGRLAARLHGAAGAATGGALLLVLGLNAGAWMLLPLHAVGAFTGQVRGMAEIHRQLAQIWLGDARILYSLAAPFAEMVSFLDKLLVGTGLNGAWVLALLYLWALVEWFAAGARSRLLWAALAIAALFLVHLVPGMAMVPVTFGMLVLAALLRPRAAWLPRPAALAAFGAATVAGLLPVVPYSIAVMRGWNPQASGLKVSYVHLGPLMPWTLLTACGVALAFAARPLARVAAERRPQAAMLAIWTAGMALFAGVSHLTEQNESKFVILVFAPLAAFGGPAFLDWLRAGFAGRPLRTGLLVLLLFGVPVLGTLAGFMVDPRGRTKEDQHPRLGETRLYAWIRDSTDRNAVFVDARFRDLVMVRARRRLLYGSVFGPERAAFPLLQVLERRAVMADLYGPGTALDRDLAVLDRLGAPAFVIYRPGDFGGARPWTALERRPDRFRVVYDRDGFRVYRALPPPA